jgi:hypothetical protein
MEPNSTDGPVTLYRIHREVAGFAKAEPPFRAVYRGPLLYWAEMSDAGAQALNNVLYGSRVAIQLADVLTYLLEGGGLTDEDWQPNVLLPARQANLSTKNGLLRVPEVFLTPAEMRPSWRVITPGAVCGTVH